MAPSPAFSRREGYSAVLTPPGTRRFRLRSCGVAFAEAFCVLHAPTMGIQRTAHSHEVSTAHRAKRPNHSAVQTAMSSLRGQRGAAEHRSLTMEKAYIRPG
jgi:hypothetical protein